MAECFQLESLHLIEDKLLSMESRKVELMIRGSRRVCVQDPDFLLLQQQGGIGISPVQDQYYRFITHFDDS